MFAEELGALAYDAGLVADQQVGTGADVILQGLVAFGAFHHGDEIPLLATQGQADFELHHAVPVAREQHDKGKFIAEDAKAAVHNVATTATDVAGNFIDDARPVRADGRYDQVVSHKSSLVRYFVAKAALASQPSGADGHSLRDAADFRSLLFVPDGITACPLSPLFFKGGSFTITPLKIGRKVHVTR